ncbi:MAG: hypothetical protein LAN62_16745 [Acidobacteriia bacterium]|nr:hypothetical protein [Terriglobia bacterium]
MDFKTEMWLNVLFANAKVVEGETTMWTALCEPDFSLYEKSEDGSIAKMVYHNRYDRGWSLVIVWQRTDGKEKYGAAKYAPGREKPVCRTDGDGDWDKFFMHVTILGPVAGGACEISPVHEVG